MRWLVLVVAACAYQPQRSGALGDDGDPDAPVDTVVPDAPPDTPAVTCPSSYTTTIGSTTSRYRILRSNATFWSHRTTCTEPGTHMAVLDTTTEATELKALAELGTQATNSRYYVGAIQDATSSTLGGSWVWLTGEPVPLEMWGMFGGIAQPDDVDTNEAGHEEQLAAFDPTATYLIDVRGSTGYGAICECDGRAENAVAVGFVDGDPNNPN